MSHSNIICYRNAPVTLPICHSLITTANVMHYNPSNLSLPLIKCHGNTIYNLHTCHFLLFQATVKHYKPFELVTSSYQLSQYCTTQLSNLSLPLANCQNKAVYTLQIHHFLLSTVKEMQYTKFKTVTFSYQMLH
jgi:hypothetical protein